MCEQPFTILNEGQLRGLAECGASGREILVYAMLARYSFRHNGLCNCNAADAADVLGISVRTYEKAVRGLTKKTFTAADGEQHAVLVCLEPGHRGRNSVYLDVLGVDARGAECDEKATPDGVATESNATPDGVAIAGIATPNCAPTAGKATPNGTHRYAETVRMVRQMEHPQDNKTKNKTLNEVTVSATSAPPTLAEWLELERRLGTVQGLTPLEDKRRLEGYRMYAKPKKIVA